MLKKNVLILSIFLCLFASSAGAAGEVQLITELTKQIGNATSNEERSRLYIYRARHFSKLKNDVQAELDYDAALEYNHQGWVHLERGKFFLSRGNAMQAAREAVVAQMETPTLKAESLKIVNEARKIYKKKQENEGPFREIILTKSWKARGKQEMNRNLAGHNVRKAYAAASKRLRQQQRSRG